MTSEEIQQRHTDSLLEKMWECGVELREGVTDIFRDKIEKVIQRRIARVCDLETQQDDRADSEIRHLEAALKQNWLEFAAILSHQTRGEIPEPVRERNEAVRRTSVETYACSLKIVNAHKSEKALYLASDTTALETLLEDALEMIDGLNRENIQQCRNMLTLYDSLYTSAVEDESATTSTMSVERHRQSKEEGFAKLLEASKKQSEEILEYVGSLDLEKFSGGGIDSLFLSS